MGIQAAKTNERKWNTLLWACVDHSFVKNNTDDSEVTQIRNSQVKISIVISLKLSGIICQHKSFLCNSYLCFFLIQIVILTDSTVFTTAINIYFWNRLKLYLLNGRFTRELNHITRYWQGLFFTEKYRINVAKIEDFELIKWM